MSYHRLIITMGWNIGMTTTIQAPDVRALTPTEQLRAELEHVGVERFVASDYKPGRVRHIVLFRFKDTVSEIERAEVTQRFLALQYSLRQGKPYIVSIERGVQTSGESAGRDYQQAFLVTFRSEGDRNYYVGRPFVHDASCLDTQHDRFKDDVARFLAPDGVVVFDYVVAGNVS